MKFSRYINESVVIQLASSANKTERSINDFLAKYSLNYLQSLILISIFFEDTKETQPGDLTSAFGTTKGNISHCLSKLEELKLVQRTMSHLDRRKCVLKLTSKGFNLSGVLIGFYDKLERRLEIATSAAGANSLDSLLRKIPEITASTAKERSLTHPSFQA